jgi:tetratricopeptide (TPR) repeat protein
VQAILAARIDRLPADEKDLLQTLAVIGKEFPLSVIKQVVQQSGDELERMLSDLQLGEFIYEQPAFPEVEYTFKHALTQEVAYNSILAERRRMIHEQTACSIERLYEQQLEDHWSELTHHYLRGIDAAKAVHYSRLAAEQAIRRSAYPEAASITEGALKVLDKIPDGADRIRAELALRVLESTLAFVRYGPSSAERESSALRMCELSETLGESEGLLVGLIALASVYFGRSEPFRGLEAAGRSLQLAEATQSPESLARVRVMAGLLAWSCGNFREAVAHFEEAVRQGERTDHKFFAGFALQVGASRSELALSIQLLGRVGDADKLAEEALRRARDSGHMFSVAHALGIGGQLLRCYRREPEIVRGHASEAIALAEENGFGLWLPWGHLLHGWALAELGQLAQGIAEMEDAIASAPPWQQYANALLAQGYAKMGRTDEALAMLNQALARIESTGERMGQAEILRLKGEVLRMRDNVATAEAEHCFRAALEVARQQEARWWELRTTVSLARLLRDTNRRDEARTVLAEIYNWFTEGFHLPDLLDAKALLDELAV